MQRLWQRACEATGDPDFGLEVADQFQPTSLHALSYAWLASSSLREAWDRMARYARLLSDELRIEVQPSDAGAWLLVSRHERRPTPHRASQDASIATLTRMCRQLRGEAFRPLRVRLAYERPESIAALSRVLMAPLEFGFEDLGMEVAAADLAAPLPTGNVELAQVSEQVIAEYLSHHDARSLGHSVKKKLLEHLPSGRVGAARVARELHMTGRTLQRQLKAEGTSYKQLLDEVRRDLASRYVGEPHVPLYEVTYLLGFSEPSNFSRAFKRWTGMTPHEYRVTRSAR